MDNFFNEKPKEKEIVVEPKFEIQEIHVPSFLLHFQCRRCQVLLRRTLTGQLPLKPDSVRRTGPNGAGKTTIINILSGIIQASTGSVKISGMDFRKHSEEISGAKNVPLDGLEGSPFSSYFIPGLILFLVNGGAFLFASIAVFGRSLPEGKIS